MRIHFIAIGGSIMHNLAISLAEQGHQISGSDDQIVEPSRTHLKLAGLLPSELGWFPEKITEELDAVILGMHADSQNPELMKAEGLGIKIYSFPEFVYEQSLEKTRVVIAGTYGKTTIMSMIMHVMKKLDVEFDYVVGAQLKGFDSLVKLTPHSKYILIEGDETFASTIDARCKFEIYKPHIALISGVEWSAKRNEQPEKDYYHRFERLILTIEPKGTLIYNKESNKLSEIIDNTKDHKINRHGYNLPNYSINKGVTYLHVEEERIPLKVIGKTNLSNIAGAFTVCEWLGIKRNEFYEAIQDFESSIRYLEFVASNKSSVVYQDFAHTASKLKSSIHAVKEQFPDHQLLTVVELNSFEIQQENFLTDYKSSLDEADYAVIYINQFNLEDKNIVLEKLIERVIDVLKHRNLQVVISESILKGFLESFSSQQVNLLLMSSSKFSQFNMTDLASSFLKNS